MIKDIFSKEISDKVIGRIQMLTPETNPQWGKMNVSQMLAHLSVMYEMVYTPEKFPKPNPLMKFILKLFAKNQVVGPKPYPKNGRTVPAFVISDKRDFETEKTKLINFIQKTQELGKTEFNGKESLSFGPLTDKEWNTLFYKHIEHHLTQFGV